MPETEEQPTMGPEAAEPGDSQSQRRKAPIQCWVPGNFENPTIMIFGDSGSGKTVFASTAPAPLFLDAENGLRSVQAEGVHFWPIPTWAELLVAVQYLIRRKHPYKTLVIDSLNEAMKLCMDAVLEEFIPGQGGVPKRNYSNLPSVNDYQKLLDSFTHFIREVKSLPMAVILIATTSGVKSVSDRIEPALTGKATVQTVARYCDVVGYLKVAESESGTPSRVLCFDTPEALTKDRSAKLPAMLWHPSWPAMAKFWE